MTKSSIMADRSSCPVTVTCSCRTSRTSRTSLQHPVSGQLSSNCQFVAARLAFKCSPKEKFLGLIVNGRRVSFAENVFCEFKLSKIASVWSVIDKAAIEAQLAG